MLEFRFHGRGGQGVVVLSKLAARLYFQLGKHVKEFPKFGVERRGAPVEGYIRVDDEPIHLNCQIYKPTHVIVMAESILETVDVTAGMTPGSTILVNSARKPEEFADRLAGFNIATIDANGIALGHGLGTELAPIANTTLFGAFAALMGCEKDGIPSAVEAELKKPAKNIDAAMEAFAALQPPKMLDGEPVKREPPPAKFKVMQDLPPMAYSLHDAQYNRTGNWRAQRPVYSFKKAPCNHQCPAGNDVRGFLNALTEGDPQRALQILLETSPLPGVCGRVCPHPCEDQCNRMGHDDAVSINALERYAEAHGGDIEIEVAKSTGKRVAIVGAGPAGLAAAWHLARRGHAVTVLEAAPEPGGMLVLGIPGYRLPRDVITREIDRIKKLGVNIKCNVAIGKDVKLDDLKAEHDAVLLAVGQQISTIPGLPGEDLPGVAHGLGFLRRHNLGEDVEVGEKVIVIGGGNTAVDVAGVAMRRSKTRDVTIVYRRTRDQMPAIREEVDHTLEEGVKLIELRAPIEVVAEGNGVRALVCDEMKLGEADSSGRPRPVPVPDSRHELECDQVILAIGQKTDLSFAKDLNFNWNDIRTNDDRLFLAGDATTGEGTVTAAIGSGREAAMEVDQFLGGEGARPVPDTWAPREDEVVREGRINFAHFPKTTRAQAPRLGVEERLGSYREVVGELEDAKTEAARCLSCGSCNGCDNCYIYCPEPSVFHRQNGAYEIDLSYCKGCGICFEECPRGMIDMKEERL